MASDTKEVPRLEVVVGTYEQFVLGYQLKSSKGKQSFEQSFANHAHNSSVRCVAASEHFVATGGPDEAIRIFSLKKRADVGTLMNHEGTINWLEFFDRTHLFSASEDGNICVWDTKSWECLKTLRGHKKAVTAISVHPSGKLLLSVSKDKTLRTWNLIKGRSAYISNLRIVGEIVKWSPSGENFIVAYESVVDVFDLKSEVIHTIDFQKHVSSVEFLTDSIIAVAGDKDSVEFHDLTKKEMLSSFKAHDNRVKSIRAISKKELHDLDEDDFLMFTISSDSHLKLWSFSIEDGTVNEPIEFASVNTTCRPTCMQVWTRKPDEPTAQDDQPQSQSKKRKVKAKTDSKPISKKSKKI